VEVRVRRRRRRRKRKTDIKSRELAAQSVRRSVERLSNDTTDERVTVR